MDVRVSVIDPNKVECDRLGTIIREHPGFQLVGSYNQVQPALKYAKHDRPDVIFTDPPTSSFSEFSYIGDLKKRMPRSRIVITSSKLSSDRVFSALSNGADGWLCKPLREDRVFLAIDELKSGGAPLNYQVARMLVDSFRKNPDTPLSKRETEVLSLLSKGKTYRNIAEELFITTETAKSHIKNIYNKLKVNTRAEALEKALQKRFI